MPFAPYTAIIDEPDPEALCSCGCCSLVMQARDLADIEECVLTPGDPSPVGRCPECQSLVYLA